LTVGIATNGVDDLGGGTIVNALTSVFEGRRDDHVMADEGIEDYIELLDP
jgi:hypothetical protein